MLTNIFRQPYIPIAQNTIAYADNDAVTRWLSQLQLYQYMQMDTTLVDSSSILQEFYDSAANCRFGYLTNIENYLGQGDVADAVTLLGTDVPGNTSTDYTTGVSMADGGAGDVIVSNYLSFYGAYINYLDSAMTGTDSSTVTSIANLCPNTNGYVVYQARALYAILSADLSIFSDDACYSSEGKNANPGNGQQQAFILQQQRYRLFPNPTHGALHIVQTVADSRPVQAQVWSEEGQSEFNGSLQFTGGMATLDMT